VWAAGIAPRKITANIIKTLGEPQKGNRLIKTDAFMRVKGSQAIYAIGDCATVECPELVSNAETLFNEADVNKDGTLTMDEISEIMKKLKFNFPLLDVEAANEILNFQLQLAAPKTVDKNSWREILAILEKNFKAVPATAQVAQQEGEYVAQLLAGKTNEPFARVDRGMMSYVGAARAVMQTPVTGAITGAVTFPLWRGAYASKLFSWRSRHLVLWDWLKKLIYGRDLSRM
jgi:NADH:ubiquinone reductase (non-electrogenic)